MKNFWINLLLTLFFLSASGIITQGQELSTPKSEANQEFQISSQPFEEVKLHFYLNKNLSSINSEIDRSQSYWKLEYELRLSDEDSLSQLQSQIYAKAKDSNKKNEKNAWMPNANKKLYKKRMKFGTLIGKGKFTNIKFAGEENSEEVVDMKLAPEIKDILARADTTNEKPSFILKIKGSLRIKTLSKIKYKNKYDKNFEYPVKLHRKGKSYIAYNEVGAVINISVENNKLILDFIRN